MRQPCGMSTVSCLACSRLSGGARTRWSLPCPITGPVTVKMVTSIIASLTKKYIRCLINTLFSENERTTADFTDMSAICTVIRIRRLTRTLTPPVSLSPYLERLEGREASLYFHIPFCAISVAIAIFFHSSVAMRSAFHCISTRCAARPNSCLWRHKA